MSIKLSFECPTQHLREYADQMDYDFALAHLVRDDEEYRKYFLEQSEKRTVILDNSMFELGAPLGCAEIAEMGKLINAHEIVAPDYPSWEQTISAVYEMKDAVERLGLNKIKILGVVQGKSMEEWMQCHRKLLTIPFVSKICICFDPAFKLGVPPEAEGSLTKTWMWSRINFMKFLGNNGFLNHDKKYHLFGMSDGIELKYQRVHPQIESCDSSSPIIHGWNKVRYTKDGLPGEKIKTKVDFSATIPKERKADIIANIKKVREWAK